MNIFVHRPGANVFKRRNIMDIFRVLLKTTRHIFTNFSAECASIIIKTTFKVN